MDGVIVDSEPIMDIVLIQFFKEMNIKFDKDIAKDFRGGSSEAFWGELKRIYSLPESVGHYVNERLKRTIEYYKKNGVRLIDNVINLIEEFRSLNIKIALATSAAHERMQVTLDLLNLEKYFDVIVTSKFINNAKPDPEIFLYACNLLNIEPKNCLVIEDSRNGIIAAKKAGMFSVGFDRAGEQDLSYADMVVNDFKENSRKNIFEFFGIKHIAPTEL
jgi:HAD superfamily hydrolase (TIGR01509 family)